MTDRPDWWLENEALKRQLGIPKYEPPRFENGVYTHTVVEELEERYGCTIRFVGLNTEYPEDWSVRVDGERVMDIGRRRDENGNTVYKTDSREFRADLVERLENRIEDAD